MKEDFVQSANRERSMSPSASPTRRMEADTVHHSASPSPEVDRRSYDNGDPPGIPNDFEADNPNPGGKWENDDGDGDGY